MLLWTCLLPFLHCWVALAEGNTVEPRISFGQFCWSLRFNGLYEKYQLSIPVRIDIDALKFNVQNTTKTGIVTLTDLHVIVDKELNSKEAGVTVTSRLSNQSHAQLLLMCETFSRCRGLRDEVVSDPSALWQAVKFVAVATVAGRRVKFAEARSANPPQINCAPNRWIVFQQRVDGSLSFAQSWDAYVRGFGDPDSNYWMGLEQLAAMTAVAENNGYTNSSPCRLRVETEDHNGLQYWGEYMFFQVLGPENNYRLRIGQMVSGTQIFGFIEHHNEMPFTTYDRNRGNKGGNGGDYNCSRKYGYGGWWYGGCYHLNLNGAYTTDKDARNPVYNAAKIGGDSNMEFSNLIPMKRTVMKFSCF